jgi:hypothetical protein
MFVLPLIDLEQIFEFADDIFVARKKVKQVPLDDLAKSLEVICKCLNQSRH